MVKIVTFAPQNKTDEIIKAIAKAGGGKIGNYTHCAFITPGFGNWKSDAQAKPYLGKPGRMSREAENKIEMICPEDKLALAVAAIKKIHPYETPVIEIYRLDLA